MSEFDDDFYNLMNGVKISTNSLIEKYTEVFMSPPDPMPDLVI